MSTIRQIRGPRAYYNKMTVEQAQCRAGQRHSFPMPDPREPHLPAGFLVISHDAQGRYKIRRDCANGCGVFRYQLAVWQSASGKNSGFRWVGKPWYDRPDDWIQVPRGVLSSAQIQAFLMNECLGLLRAAARQSATA